MPRAGLKDRLIVLRAPVKDRDNNAGPVVTYPVDTHVNLWAHVIPASGTERFRGMREISVEDLVFEINYLDGITSEFQIGYNGESYDMIMPPKEFKRKEGLEFVGRLIK